MASETARPVFEPRKRPQIAGYSSETGKRRFESDCVVGLEGLKPPTRLLWREAPARDIFDWPGQKERACDVGRTVETSVPMPEPGRVPGFGQWGASVAHCSCKRGKRAGTGPARSVSREPDEECKGQLEAVAIRVFEDTISGPERTPSARTSCRRRSTPSGVLWSRSKRRRRGSAHRLADHPVENFHRVKRARPATRSARSLASPGARWRRSPRW